MRYCALSTTMKSLTRTYAQVLFQHFFGLHKVFAEPAIALHEVQEEAYGLRVDLRHDNWRRLREAALKHFSNDLRRMEKWKGSYINELINVLPVVQIGEIPQDQSQMAYSLR